jgi:16S rRNA (cytidine1402-2'-O)-methyltransferase
MSLVFVPTPLGNLRDITLRALDVLRDAELIVAEDTRVTRRLLSAHGISKKKLWSYREQNAAAATPGILERAASALVAVVSDAGTPGVSDPGRELLIAARAAGIPVEVLPGPVAFVVAAVLSGFALAGLTFEGFLPRTASARDIAIRLALTRSGPTVWYESPKRIAGSLAALDALAPDAPVFVARELSKRFEQQLLGRPRAVLETLGTQVLGEIVVILEPPQLSATPPTIKEVDERVLDLLAGGAGTAQVAKVLAKLGLGDRRALYERAVALREQIRRP